MTHITSAHTVSSTTSHMATPNFQSPRKSDHTECPEEQKAVNGPLQRPPQRVCKDIACARGEATVGMGGGEGSSRSTTSTAALQARLSSGKLHTSTQGCPSTSIQWEDGAHPSAPLRPQMPPRIRSFLNAWGEFLQVLYLTPAQSMGHFNSSVDA